MLLRSSAKGGHLDLQLRLIQALVSSLEESITCINNSAINEAAPLLVDLIVSSRALFTTERMRVRNENGSLVESIASFFALAVRATRLIIDLGDTAAADKMRRVLKSLELSTLHVITTNLESADGVSGASFSTLPWALEVLAWHAQARELEAGIHLRVESKQLMSRLLQQIAAATSVARPSYAAVQITTSRVDYVDFSRNEWKKGAASSLAKADKAKEIYFSKGQSSVKEWQLGAPRGLAVALHLASDLSIPLDAAVRSSLFRSVARIFCARHTTGTKRLLFTLSPEDVLGVLRSFSVMGKPAPWLIYASAEVLLKNLSQTRSSQVIKRLPELAWHSTGRELGHALPTWVLSVLGQLLERVSRVEHGGIRGATNAFVRETCQNLSTLDAISVLASTTTFCLTFSRSISNLEFASRKPVFFNASAYSSAALEIMTAIWVDNEPFWSSLVAYQPDSLGTDVLQRCVEPAPCGLPDSTTPEGVSAHVLHSVYTTWSELRNSQGESEDAASTEVHPLGELKASLLKLAMIFPRSLLQRLPNGTLRFIGTTQRCLLLSVQMALIQLEAGTAALRDDSDADRSEHDSWPWEVLKHVFYSPPQALEISPFSTNVALFTDSGRLVLILLRERTKKTVDLDNARSSALYASSDSVVHHAFAVLCVAAAHCIGRSSALLWKSVLLQDALDAADTAMTLQRILDAAEFRSFCNSDAAWSQDLPFQRAISLAYALCGEMAISAMKAASQHTSAGIKEGSTNDALDLRTTAVAGKTGQLSAGLRNLWVPPTSHQLLLPTRGQVRRALARLAASTATSQNP